jgi:hypothetical protein
MIIPFHFLIIDLEPRVIFGLILAGLYVNFVHFSDFSSYISYIS